MKDNLKPLFLGTCTAMITPFTNDGIDFLNLKKQIEYQLDGGIKALLVLGTTGESPTLTYEEYQAVIEFTVKTVNKRAVVIVGSGSNCTKTAVEKSKLAENLGADGLLAVTPYYNKCTQNGLIEYYKTIAQSVNIPIIAYNVPSRTGVNILPETMAKIAQIENVVAIKEACGDLKQIAKTAELIKGNAYLYSGDDSLTLDMLSFGACGSISVCSNALPKQTEDIFIAFKKGELEKAKKLHTLMAAVMKDMFIEVNPIPVKYAMQLLGLDSGILRAPLTEIEDEHKEIVKRALISCGVKL